MATVGQIVTIGGTTLVLTWGAFKLNEYRNASPEQPPAKVYSIGADGVSRYFTSLEKELDFLKTLSDEPPSVPYSNSGGRNNDVIITGYAWNSKNNIICNNFDEADVIFDCKKESFRGKITPKAKKKFFEMIGADPEAMGAIYNGREILVTDNENLIITNLYRIGVYGLSESDIRRIEENIFNDEYSALTITEWWNDKHRRLSCPISTRNEGDFVNIKVDRKYVDFSTRGYTEINDQRPLIVNDVITFTDEGKEFKRNARTIKQQYHDITISSNNIDLIASKRKGGKASAELNMKPPFTIKNTFTNKPRNSLPGGGRRR